MSKDRTTERVFPFLDRLDPLKINLGLDRIEKVVGSIGSPHKSFDSILVAGTNGKGSTATMIASIVSFSDQKIGLYKSPHLEELEERISINGKNIERERFISIAKRVEGLPIIKEGETCLTYFEFITLVAFIYFAEEGVDLAVLEVGLGGRLDATNVVNPLISVITEIDIDHADILGGTIAKIAAEKGGIIRGNGTVVLASKNREAVETITTICHEKKAKLYLLGTDFDSNIVESDSSGQLIDFRGSEDIKGIKLSLVGAHQARNGGAAVQAALLLNGPKFKIGGEEVRGGLASIKIAGRLETVSAKPTILLDIAHNYNGALALATAIKENFKYKELCLILGILKDKDIGGIISILAPLADRLFIVRPNSERAAEPDMIFSEAKKYLSDIHIVEDVGDALREALLSVSEEDLICVTGSAVTVGEARKVCLTAGSINI
ncbi:MAG: folylpolyglutamate synthase/dihydrofolate synthase family protein [Nitrospinota bacterium]|nr:bifunctional folylpolyglutamate synthase/dihydrofolate synthase [Nitrospinota bacterium]